MTERGELRVEPTHVRARAERERQTAIDLAAVAHTLLRSILEKGRELRVLPRFNGEPLDDVSAERIALMQRHDDLAQETAVLVERYSEAFDALLMLAGDPADGAH